jgi:hypothetical protein
VTASGGIVTLTIAEGAGAANTAVGTFTVALATNATGVRDAAGNLSSFTAIAPTDAAGPVPTALTFPSFHTAGKFDKGDQMRVTFSEPLATLVTTVSTATEADPTGAGNDTINVPGFTLGALDMGADSYITNDGTTATFTGNLSQPSTTDVQVDTAGGCSGTCGGNIQPGGPGNFTFRPSTSLTDVIGNAAAGSFLVAATRVF